MKKDLDSYILTRQELLIMKVIWDRGSATVRDVCDVISEKKATAYTTILTLMQILERKGTLVRKRVGRSYLYTPLFSRRQATRNQVNDLLVRFFDGNPNKLIETVLENEFQPSKPLKSGATREKSDQDSY
jgi:predicted transcriptional regulator